jgi:hypothetical protein
MVLGGGVLLAGLSSASAAQPVGDELSISTRAVSPEAEKAFAKAAEFRRLAGEYRKLGGAGEKGGLVRRAEEAAARYEAEGARVQAAAEGVDVLSPEAAAWARKVEEYRRLGGVAYKNGLVQRAEAKLRENGGLVYAVPAATPGLERPFGWGKPIEGFLSRVK